MSGTNGNKQHTTVVDKLRTADQRWARRNSDQPATPEYLEHLACSIQTVAVPSNGDGEPPISDAEAARLREQVVAAENNAAARRAELDQARAEIVEVREAFDAEHHEAMRATGALESARRERDQLAEQLAEASKTVQNPPVDLEKGREQAKLIRQLRADYDAVAGELTGARTELAAMQTERDHLAERLGAATSHRCTWRWHGPDEAIKPCSCGRPVPRYELHEVG